MIYFNSNNFTIDVLDETSIIIDVESQDVIFLNNTAKIIFEGLIGQKNIECIVNEFITNQNIDLSSVPYNTILKDFSEAAELFFEKGVLLSE